MTNGKQLFDIAAGCAVGIKMLKALQEVHKKGIIHKDTDASNFCLAKPVELESIDTNYVKNADIVLIDFGLSDIYEDKKE